jgi:putative DNA primase/helicase
MHAEHLPIEERALIEQERERTSIYSISSVDRQPIPLPALPAAMAFDMALMPNTLRPWIEDMADRLQCPPDLFSIPSVVGAGAILGRKIGIRPQENSDWTELPNMWGCIIGRPGTLKSPAMSLALAPVRQLQARAREEHGSRMREFAKLCEHHALREKAAKKAATKALEKDASSKIELPDEPEPPTLRRYIANDSNIASLGELLRQNPNGMLVDRDELVGLLRGLDREEKAEERAFYLTGWNGKDSYTFDRILRGLDLHIPAVTLSVIGGAQPGRIAEYLRHAVKGTSGDDGLMQRFSMLTWPDHSGKWKDVDRWPDTDARTRAFDAFAYLNRIEADDVGVHRDQFDPLPYLRFSPGGLAAFREWRVEIETRLRGETLHPAMVSHLSKYRKTIPGLALVMHLIDGGIGPVSEAATARALAWSKYLESHADRAYASVTASAATAARLILKRLPELPDPFTPREVYRNGWSGLSERESVRDALETLADHRYLYAETVETGGRPSLAYRVNPMVRA